MEVHHHPHVEKKGFKEYFLEFLMIFLAVTLGFFAENIREHISDNAKEEEYMKSMLIDLETDTAHFKGTVKLFTEVSDKIDSLSTLLSRPDSMNENAQKIYEKEMYLYIYPKLVYTNHTLLQLKSSGNFRLIRNKQIVDGMLQYDGTIQNNVVDMQNEYVGRQKEKVGDAKNLIFKSGEFLNFIKSDYMTGNFNSYKIQLPSPPYFLTTDKNQIEIFINELQEYNITIEWFIENIKRGIEEATTLDLLIRKEYHLH